MALVDCAGWRLECSWSSGRPIATAGARTRTGSRGDLPAFFKRKRADNVEHTPHGGRVSGAVDLGGVCEPAFAQPYQQEIWLTSREECQFSLFDVKSTTAVGGVCVQDFKVEILDHLIVALLWLGQIIHTVALLRSPFG